MTSGRGCQSPWRLIKQLTSSLFPLWGLLSIVPIPGPPLSFHLGRATWRHWACLPASLRGPAGRQPEAGGAWSPAEPAWGCVAESHADHASPGPAPPHTPAYFQDQTALSWLTNGFNTKQQQICQGRGRREKDKHLHDNNNNY